MSDAGSGGQPPAPSGGEGGQAGGGGGPSSGQGGQAGAPPTTPQRTGCWWDAYEAPLCSQSVCGAEDIHTLNYLPSQLSALGQRLYWVNFAADEVMSAPKDGSQPPQVIWKAIPLPGHLGVTIHALSPAQPGIVILTRNVVSHTPSVTSDAVYLVASDGKAKELYRVAGEIAGLGTNDEDAYILHRRELVRLPLTGAPPVREVQNAPAGAQMFVPRTTLAANRVYLASDNLSGDNSVFRLRDGQLETLGTLGGVRLSGIYEREGDVFVIARDRDQGDFGGLWRVSQAGTPTRVKSGSFGPSVLAFAGGRTLIWHDDRSDAFAQAIDVTGQCFVSLGPTNTDQIAFDESFLYWQDKTQRKIRRLRVDHPTAPADSPKARAGEPPEAFRQLSVREGVERLANKEDAWAFCRDAATGTLFYVSGYGLCGRGRPLFTKRAKGLSQRMALFEWRDWQSPELGKPSVGAIFFFSGGGFWQYECVSTNGQLAGEKDVNSTRPPNEPSPPSVCDTGDVFPVDGPTTLRWVLPSGEVANIELSSVAP